MFRALGDAAGAAASDPDIHAVLVRAEGPSFSAGIDLGVLVELAGSVQERLADFVALAQRPSRLLATMPKPTVAAIRGHALGAGFQLALACDLRVAASDATFGLLEARYGLIPDLGGLYHLAREAGPARAKELAWSARTIDAAEADRLGLLNGVVEPDRLEDEARSLANAVIAHAPVTVRLVKRLVAGTFERTPEDELSHEADAQAEALRSEDHREAVAAFLEQRPPRFTGK
jgi:enoyl-CoA hydratase/carnithine racemase